MPTAKEIMTREVITVKENLNLKELSKLFIEHRVNGFPVLDDEGAMVGMVTERDLIDQNKNPHVPTVIALFDAVIYLESGKKFEDDLKKFTGTKVKDIYSPKVVMVTPDTTLGEITSIMAERGTHSLPVMEDGKLIGIIGKRDVIKGMAQD